MVDDVLIHFVVFNLHRSLLETYGEVYFRAWRLSTGPYLKQIEEHCLQDLMYSAVHAPRLGQQSLFHSLRKVSVVMCVLIDLTIVKFTIAEVEIRVTDGHWTYHDHFIRMSGQSNHSCLYNN